MLHVHVFDQCQYASDIVVARREFYKWHLETVRTDCTEGVCNDCAAGVTRQMMCFVFLLLTLL